MKQTSKHQRAVTEIKKSLDPSRAERLEKVQKKIDDLRSRGVLKKQEYKTFTVADYERWRYRNTTY